MNGPDFWDSAKYRAVPCAEITQDSFVAQGGVFPKPTCSCQEQNDFSFSTLQSLENPFIAGILPIAKAALFHYGTNWISAVFCRASFSQVAGTHSFHFETKWLVGEPF